MSTYQIADEPKASPLSHLTVDPLWPLFAVMFSSALFSWAWYVFNGKAMGSPSFAKELKTVILGFIGSTVFVFMTFALVGKGTLAPDHIPYALIVLTLWKLGISYTLYSQQSRVFSLFVYFNGKPKNGFVGVIAGFFFAQYVLVKMASTFWLIVLR